MIDSFRGTYAFLSNFHPATVEFEGLVYPSVEHAFQAAKSLDPAQRRMVQAARTAKDAKRMGRALTLRSDWEDVKVGVMCTCVASKFSLDPTLAQALIRTAPHSLVEGNTWGDTFWGKVDGIGRNMLGRILMGAREQLILEAQRDGS